jgi:hypothetical protein
MGSYGMSISICGKNPNAMSPFCQQWGHEILIIPLLGVWGWFMTLGKNHMKS